MSIFPEVYKKAISIINNPIDMLCEDGSMSVVPTNKAKEAVGVMQEEVARLEQQLAKANERVKELELVIVAITHADETGYVDDVGFVQGWSEVCDQTKSLLNKFAIEQQIKGMQRVLDCRELNLSQGEIDTIKLMQEQLC